MVEKIVLPISPQWWTAEMLAPELGVSVETVYRRARELRDRGILAEKRCIWTPDEARQLATYIVASGHRREKVTVV